MRTIRNCLIRLIGDEHGKVLILALVFLVLGALLLTPLLGLMSTGLTAGRVYENRTHSLYAADAGVEDGVNWLMEGRPTDWPWTGDDEGPWQRTQELEVNQHNVGVTIEVYGLPEDSKYLITSESVKGGSGTQVIALVMVQPRFQGCYLIGNQTFGNQSPPPEGSIIVVGTVEIEHNQTVGGDMSIDGDLNMSNRSGISTEGGLCVTGTVRMGNNTEISAAGGIMVGGDLEIANNCDVYGDLFIFGDIVFENNANSRIHDNVYAYEDITIWLGHPQSKIYGTVYSTGAVTVIPESRIGNIYHIEENQDPDSYPDKPDCPSVGTQGTVVDTYQVMGYGE